MGVPLFSGGSETHRGNVIDWLKSNVNERFPKNSEFRVHIAQRGKPPMHVAHPWDGTPIPPPTIRNPQPAGEPVSNAWTALGPAPILNGQRPGAGPVSGRIAGIAAHPTDPNTIYVAAAGGGVWETTDGGTNWTSLTDNQVTLSMGAIALAPSNPLMIYVGPGGSEQFL
jgi:hypothetical protein